MVGVLNGEYSLKDRTFSLLYPLAHRMQVGGEVARGGEYTLVVFALALAVKLFPPLAYEVQFRLEIDHDFYFLASLLV